MLITIKKSKTANIKSFQDQKEEAMYPDAGPSAGGVAMLKVGLVAMLEVESSNYRVVNRGGVLQSLPVCLLVSLPCALSSQTWHLYQQRNHLIYVPLEVEGIKLLGDQPMMIISWVFKIDNKLAGREFESSKNS